MNNDGCAKTPTKSQEILSVLINKRERRQQLINIIGECVNKLSPILIQSKPRCEDKERLLRDRDNKG
jgi:hypothetical protein